MKKIFIWFSLLLVSLFAQEDASNKMVAKVGDTIITEKILMSVVNSKMSRDFFHSSLEDNKLLELKKSTLSTLIDRELIFQYAKEKGYALSEQDLIEEEKKILSAFDSEQDFKMALSRSQMTYETFKYEVEKEKAMNNVYQAEIKRSFTEDDLKKYYDENQYKFKKPESISIQLIFIQNDPTDKNGTQKVKQRIKEAFDLIKSGEDFGEVASEYSNDKSRIKGGIIKDLHRGMIDSSVEDEAFSLKVGDVSKIIERTVGSYLVKVIDKQSAIQLSFEEVKSKLEIELKTQREKEALANLLNMLKSKITVVNALETP